MERKPLICPSCGAQLVMYEHYIEYYDGDTIIMTEHYECEECRKQVPDDLCERIATYTLEKESWT